MTMNTQTRLEVRLGLIAQILVGLFFTLGVAIRGPLDRDTASLMRAALSANFGRGAVISLVGAVLQIYALFGLYRLLTYQRQSLIALPGVILSVAGIVFVIPLVAFLAVNLPVIARLYQQGDHGLIPIVESSSTGLGLVLLSISSGLGSIGTVLLAAAIWQHGRPFRWIGVVWALKGLLLAFSGPGHFATELLGAMLTLMIASVIAWKGWRESMPQTGKNTSAPAGS